MSNILFVSPNPIWGGAATANLSIAKMLQDNGHNVIFNDEYSETDEFNTVKIDHTPIHQKKFSDRKLLYKLVNENKVDYIIWSPLVAIYFYKELTLLKKSGIHQLAIVHSLSLTKNFKGRLMDLLVSFTLAKMSTIIFVSEYTKNSWLKFSAVKKSKANKVVIHNLVDISASTHSLNKKPRIGFVGRLSEEKQPQLFCELSLIKDFDFVVYGEGPLISSLKPRFKSVEFKGQCRDSAKIYSSIDILIMTSKFENCPMVILEAQAFGIPCIAPNVGGLPELIDSGNNGILYDDYNPKTIITAINNIISNYSKFASKSLESSKNHTPSKTIKYWEEILN